MLFYTANKKFIIGLKTFSKGRKEYNFKLNYIRIDLIYIIITVLT